jgi:hypothetical protein
VPLILILPPLVVPLVVHLTFFLVVPRFLFFLLLLFLPLPPKGPRRKGEESKPKG